MKTFNYATPHDLSYWDHLNQNFREFVRVVGGGSRVVRCHSSVAPLFDFIGITPKVDDDMRHGEATIAGTRILIENLE